MKLSTLACSVIRALETDGEAASTTIARALKTREHRVRYEVQRRLAAPSTSRRVAVNTYQLGFMRHAFFLTLKSQTQAARTRFLTAMRQSRWVSLLLELGGEFQFEINLTTRSMTELETALEWLSGACGSQVLMKNVAVQLSHCIYGSKVLGKSPLRAPPIRYGASGPVQSIDEVDHRLLTALMSPESISLREIARRLQVPPATIDARYRRLKERGIISGVTYLFEGLGLHHYVLLVHTRGLDAALRRKITAFAEHHWAVHYSVENLGSWDFELGIEVMTPEQVSEVLQDVYTAFEHEVTLVKAIPILKRHKVIDYPAGSLPEDAGPRQRNS